MSKKSLLAQHIANAFPLWSDMRISEQSLGRQFLNPTGNIIDEMHEQIQKISDNYYVSTACVSDIDVYHYVRLPQDFEFQKEDDDNTEWIFTPPPVSGVVGSTYIPVELAVGNDVESFWYDVAPTRVSLEATVSGACLLASGILQGSPIPLIIPSGVVDVPNKLYVTVSGEFAYIHSDDTGYVSQTIIQIDGTTRAGARVTEEMYYIHADTLRTRNDFQQVHETRCYYTPYNTTATIRVETAGFNMAEYPAAYQLMRNEYKEDVVMFWGLGSGPLPGQRTLNVRKYDTDDELTRLGGYTGKHDAISFELVDEDGNYVDARDMAIEQHSNHIWVVSSGMLYLYDADLYYPNTKTLEGKDYDAPAIIEASTYNIVPGETVRFYYVWKRPLSEIIGYRIWVIKPDGTKRSVVDGSEIAYMAGAGSWQPGPIMINRNIQSPDEFTFAEAGDYTYCLEVRYVDESTSLDKKIICVQSKSPKAQFPLATIVDDWRPITGIDIDSEYKIWVKNTNDWRYQIDLHYDNMLIDWNRKIVYFHEAYDQVRIFDYTE